MENELAKKQLAKATPIGEVKLAIVTGFICVPFGIYLLFFPPTTWGYRWEWAFQIIRNALGPYGIGILFIVAGGIFFVIGILKWRKLAK